MPQKQAWISRYNKKELLKGLAALSLKAQEALIIVPVALLLAGLQLIAGKYQQAKLLPREQEQAGLNKSQICFLKKTVLLQQELL